MRGQAQKRNRIAAVGHCFADGVPCLQRSKSRSSESSLAPHEKRKKDEKTYVEFHVEFVAGPPESSILYAIEELKWVGDETFEHESL